MDFRSFLEELDIKLSESAQHTEQSTTGGSAPEDASEAKRSIFEHIAHAIGLSNESASESSGFQQGAEKSTDAETPTEGIVNFVSSLADVLSSWDTAAPDNAQSADEKPGTATTGTHRRAAATKSGEVNLAGEKPSAATPGPDMRAAAAESGEVNLTDEKPSAATTKPDTQAAATEPDEALLASTKAKTDAQTDENTDLSAQAAVPKQETLSGPRGVVVGPAKASSAPLWESLYGKGLSQVPIDTYVLYKKDKPAYIPAEENVWVFGKDKGGEQQWDLRRLRDEEYCRSWKVASGSYDILPLFAVPGGAAAIGARSVLVFVDSIEVGTGQHR